MNGNKPLVMVDRLLMMVDRMGMNAESLKKMLMMVEVNGMLNDNANDNGG